MKSLYLCLILSLLLLILCGFNTKAQTEQNKNAEAIVNKILSDSERYFKEGELNLKDKLLAQAMEKFDKAVEVFLFSTMNIRSNKKLNESYLQLIDKIHQLEMSSKNKSVPKRNFDVTDSTACSVKSEINKKTIDLLIQSLESYKNQDYDDSLSSLRKLLVEEPMNSLAYLLMGKIHSKRGDLDQAISYFKTALFWDNHLIETHIELGRIYIIKGDELQAKNYLQTALYIEQDNPKVEILSRLIDKQATANDRKILEQDASEIENWISKLTKEKTDNVTNIMLSRNLMFVAPFQSVNENNSLSQDFSYVLSNLLAVPGFCVVSYDKNKNLLESFGIEPEESITLATALKLAMASKADVLVVGSYEINKGNSWDNFKSIRATAKIIKVNEGRFLSEEFDTKRITRNIVITDKAENLRTLQAQIAYNILYLQDKILTYSQNDFIEKVSSLEIPKRFNNLLGLRSANYGELDFSVSNSLKRTNCNENALNNVQLRGFKLGMTFNEILKIIPKAQIKNINSFEKQISVSPKISPTKEARFNDINSIRLNFFDNNLYSIEIIYDDAIKWNGLDEFSNQVEKTLNLPKLKRDEYEFDGNYLFCGNYQLKIMFANYKTPAIHFFDTTVFDKIVRRKKEERDKALQKKIEEEKLKLKAEEEKKKVFNP